MFDETIILQRSLENSHVLPNIDELLCDFSQTAIAVCFPQQILWLRNFCV
jgi:hypothetical protein